MAEFRYTDAQMEYVLYSIYTGKITPLKLPKDLYFAISDYLKKGLYSGFGSMNFGFGKPDEILLAELRSNVYMFSAAKTFQQVKEMSDALIDGKKFRPFNDFMSKGEEIFKTYNKTYLRTEYETAKGMGRVGAKWERIERDKEVFPLVRYVAVLSGNTCEICEGLNRMTLPVGHPFWNKYAPLNHFNCLCILEQITAEEGNQSPSWRVEKANKDVGAVMDDTFKMNPGKDKVVFKDSGKGKHPYFDVEPKYKKFAQDNFNLPIPDKDE